MMKLALIGTALVGPLSLAGLGLPALPAPEPQTAVVFDLLEAPGAPVEGEVVPTAGATGSTSTVVAALSRPKMEPAEQADEEALRHVPGGYEIVTAALESDPFYIAGVTWVGQAPERVDIRVKEDIGWSTWYTLELETDGIAGTEPFMTGGATSVQVRLAGEVVPSSVDLTLTAGAGHAPVEETPEASEDQPTDTVADAAVNDVSFFVPQRELGAMPASLPQSLTGGALPQVIDPTSIISRAEWGITRVPPAWTPSWVPLQATVIHHTAGTNNYTAAQSAGIVRSIHDYHTYSRGWDDIGYNFLVDKYGQVFEGRYGTLSSAPGEMVIGAHAAPANTGTVGISVMGTYMNSVRPSDLVLTKIEDIIAWQFSLAGVDPFGTWTYRNRAGAMVTANTILGHKDVSSTACPGTIYDQLGRIRTRVNDQLHPSDPMTMRSDKTIRLFKTDDFAPISKNVQFFGYPGDEFYVGNFGRGDLPFVRRGNEFIVAAGPTSPTAVTSYTIGTGREQVFTGAIDVAGQEALILRTGNRFDIYDSLSQTRPSRSVYYGKASDEVYVYDWDGDGKSEIAVRRGNQFHLKWTVSSGNADKVIGYGRAGDDVYPGRWSSNPAETLMVRRGNTYYVSYSAKSGNADKKFSYGRATDKVVVGDWNSDGRDGVGVVRLP